MKTLTLTPPPTNFLYLKQICIYFINIPSPRKNYDRLLALLNILPFPLHAIYLIETLLRDNEHSCFPLPRTIHWPLFLVGRNARSPIQKEANVLAYPLPNYPRDELR